MSGPAIVFLDRDGVINRKKPDVYFIQTPSQFEFLPGVAEAIRLLNYAGHRVVVATNQRGISTGAHTEEDLRKVHLHMTATLAAHGATIDAIYYCPHGPGSCTCRKPEIGLFLQAFSDLECSLPAQCVVVGDSMSDMEAAHRLGCPKVLIGDNLDALVASAADRGISIDFCESSLLQAVKTFILPVLQQKDSTQESM